MSRTERMLRLAAMAEIVLNARSCSLNAAADRRQDILDAIGKLARSPDPADDLAAVRAGFAWEGWAAARRTTLLLSLAKAEVEWREAHTEASRAFGRLQLLQRLAKGRVP